MITWAINLELWFLFLGMIIGDLIFTMHKGCEPHLHGTQRLGSRDGIWQGKEKSPTALYVHLFLYWSCFLTFAENYLWYLIPALSGACVHTGKGVEIWMHQKSRKSFSEFSFCNLSSFLSCPNGIQMQLMQFGEAVWSRAGWWCITIPLYKFISVNVSKYTRKLYLSVSLRTRISFYLQWGYLCFYLCLFIIKFWWE